VIPLDILRDVLANVANPGPWSVADHHNYRPVVNADGNIIADDVGDDAPLIAAAPDLARDVLSLADALATAEASIAQLRADLERADHERQRVESERDAMEEQRDTARSALDGLTAAVRAEREARIAVVARVARCEVVRDSHECVSGMAHDRLREARALHDKATAHLDALLAAAPPRSTVDARVVRAYLAAEETYDLVAADWPPSGPGIVEAGKATRAARAAIVAALARCA